MREVMRETMTIGMAFEPPANSSARFDFRGLATACVLLLTPNFTSAFKSLIAASEKAEKREKEANQTEELAARISQITDLKQLARLEALARRGVD
jgi:hypothetical protein